MDRSITPRPNPADRLDEVCQELAELKCDRPKRLIAYQITLMVEALRDRACASETFWHELNELADYVETRLKSLEAA